MNERMAAMGDQVKEAFSKLGDSWKNQEPARKKKMVIALIALLALIVAAVIAMNMMGNRYVVLYEGMARDESVSGLSALQSAGMTGRINDAGELEVPSNMADAAMGQLAMAGIPNSTLDYSIFKEAGGLTTTDFEKRQFQINQQQNRLQDIIRTYAGVSNAYVTLNINASSNRVWDAGSSPNSGSVKVDLEPGAVLTPGQISGIRYLVAASVGINADDVAVIDAGGTVLAAAGDGANTEYASAQEFLQRQSFEEEVEGRMRDKAANILSVSFPSADSYSISVTAVLDYDAMITESMEYIPFGDTTAGITEREGIRATMGTGQFTEGVVGETDNTDIPIYADLDGDGQMDTVNYSVDRDFLVSYLKSQIEKDGAKLTEASIAVAIRGTVTPEDRQKLRELIAAATNLPVESITVEGLLDKTVEDDKGQTAGNTILGLPPLFIYIAAGVLAVLVLLLILISIIRARLKKKRKVAEQAEMMAEQEEQERVQKEIEERKRQLKDAAAGDTGDDAITDEVRDFARTNPEITANLLRNWMKEGE